MKILYCIAGTYRSGGMERVLCNKVNYLVGRGFDVIVVTTDQRERSPFFAFDKRVRFFDLDINYEENNGKSVFNKIIKYPTKLCLHYIRLRKLLNREHPDISISMFCNDVSFLPLIHDGSVKLLEIHFSRFKRLQYGRKGLWRLLDRMRSVLDKQWARMYEKFVVLTYEDAGLWGKMPNLEVVYNASPYKTDCKSDLSAKKVLAVGRYTFQKGFDLLLQSWHIVTMKCPDWKLEIVGEGTKESIAQLKRLISRYQLADSVVLTAPTSDITEKYLSSSFVAMSSRYEGLPMILIESQTFGLPVVCFDCHCGPSDIIRNGVNGFLVKMGEIESFAEKMTKLIRDPRLRLEMGREARLNSSRFDEDIIMKKWINIFKEVLYVKENHRSLGC